MRPCPGKLGRIGPSPQREPILVKLLPILTNIEQHQRKHRRIAHNLADTARVPIPTKFAPPPASAAGRLRPHLFEVAPTWPDLAFFPRSVSLGRSACMSPPSAQVAPPACSGHRPGVPPAAPPASPWALAPRRLALGIWGSGGHARCVRPLKAYAACAYFRRGFAATWHAMVAPPYYINRHVHEPAVSRGGFGLLARLPWRW